MMFVLTKKEVVKGDYSHHENYYVEGVFTSEEKAQRQIKKLTRGMIRAASYDSEDMCFETEDGYVEYYIHCFSIDGAAYRRKLIGITSYCL